MTSQFPWQESAGREVRRSLAFAAMQNSSYLQVTLSIVRQAGQIAFRVRIQ
jgi:hypothetical protein